MNRKAVELFDSMKEFLIFPLKRKVGGKEGDVEFKDKDEYIKFLMSDDSLVMWREGPDLAVVAHLLRSRVDVLISKDNKLDGGCPMVYGEEFEDRGRIVLVLSEEEKHYYAVVDTQNPNDNLRLLEALKTYVNNANNDSDGSVLAISKDSEDKDVQNATQDDIRAVNSRLDAITKRFTNLQAKYDGKIFRLEEENKVLMGLLSKRGPQPQVRAAPVAPPAAQPVPVPPPAAQPAQVPAGDTGPMDLDKEEFSQLKRLHDMKQQGFQRQSPAAPPVRKGFLCVTCKIQFDKEENLKKHKDTKHPDKEDTKKKMSSNVQSEPRIPDIVLAPINNVINEAAMKKIPSLNGQARKYNCLECSFQADGKASSKSLLRHSKQTGHRTSPLEEKCYTCQAVCPNFEELMVHRRENHKDNINFCRYLSEDSCKFGSRCWYSHDQAKKNDSSKQNLGFRREKGSIPPDMMQGLTVLLSDLIAQHLDRKKSPGA